MSNNSTASADIKIRRRCRIDLHRVGAKGVNTTKRESRSEPVQRFGFRRVLPHRNQPRKV
jgi:hypothetical protein